MEENEQIGILIYKYVSQEISTEEKVVLEKWIAESEDNKVFFEEAINSEDILKEIIERHKVVSDEDMERAWLKMTNMGLVPGFTKVIKQGWTWWRYPMAAAVLVTVALGSYLFFYRSKPASVDRSLTEVKQADISPGQAKAVLTLSDGRKVVLDSASSQIVAVQGNVSVKNQNGQLVYTGSNNGAEVIYNTLSTAKAQTYATVLADGSKVWLNSASSIRYPVAFVGKERFVEIEGEAYFEVAHNKAKPFKILVNDVQVEVTGTSFNIQAYSDESMIRTTLLEGGVKITSIPSSSGSEKATNLKPGQQAQFRSDKSIAVIDNVDVEQVTAWTSGLFHFKNNDLETIMRQISRWYDVEVAYADNIPNTTYSGKIRRSSNLSQVLAVLESAGLHFKIEDKKVIVTQ